MAIHIEEVEFDGKPYMRIWPNQRMAKNPNSDYFDVNMANGMIVMEAYGCFALCAAEAKLRITMLQKAVEISEGVTGKS